jgi:dienelactone hydrolase
VHEHHLDIKTADGTMNTFITHPEEGGPHPVVFFYMDAPGKREELHPGVHHGFGFPQRPAYDKPAAERHWERRFSLFARNLADV